MSFYSWMWHHFERFVFNIFINCFFLVLTCKGLKPVKKLFLCSDFYLAANSPREPLRQLIKLLKFIKKLFCSAYLGEKFPFPHNFPDEVFFCLRFAPQQRGSTHFIFLYQSREMSRCGTGLSCHTLLLAGWRSKYHMLLPIQCSSH